MRMSRIVWSWGSSSPSRRVLVTHRGLICSARTKMHREHETSVGVSWTTLLTASQDEAQNRDEGVTSCERRLRLPRYKKKLSSTSEVAAAGEAKIGRNEVVLHSQHHLLTSLVHLELAEQHGGLPASSNTAHSSAVSTLFASAIDQLALLPHRSATRLPVQKSPHELSTA